MILTWYFHKSSRIVRALSFSRLNSPDGTRVEFFPGLFRHILHLVFLPTSVCFLASGSVSSVTDVAGFVSVSAPRVQAALLLAERGVVPLPTRAEGGRAPQHDQRAAGGGRPHPAQVSPHVQATAVLRPVSGAPASADRCLAEVSETG